MILEKLKDNPWRFAVGDEAYVAGWSPAVSVKITAAFGHGRSAWPHYVVVDYEGIECTVPQQCLSRTPILP
jgi:hypothetical protein